jgi:hypothetical protein
MFLQLAASAVMLAGKQGDCRSTVSRVYNAQQLPTHESVCSFQFVPASSAVGRAAAHMEP